MNYYEILLNNNTNIISAVKSRRLKNLQHRLIFKIHNQLYFS
jgi:hypothetical protein